MDNIGQKIKEKRLQKKLTQKQLAEKLSKTDRTRLNRIENGKLVATVNELLEIAAALKISPKSLVG